MQTRLPMILTVVLYVGESKWNVAKRLGELEIIHPGFEGMFNEFKLNLIELNRLEVYQTMLDKGFSVKAIASIFSVSEESIKKLLMKV